MAIHPPQRCTTVIGSAAGTISAFASTERSACGIPRFSTALTKTEPEKGNLQWRLLNAFNESDQPQSPKSGSGRERGDWRCSSSSKKRRRRKDLLSNGVHAELHSRMGSGCLGRHGRSLPAC